MQIVDHVKRKVRENMIPRRNKRVVTEVEKFHNKKRKKEYTRVDSPRTIRHKIEKKIYGRIYASPECI